MRDRPMNLVRELTENLTWASARVRELEVQTKALEEREARLHKIALGLFEITEPGSVKNSLWALYLELYPADGEKKGKVEL